MSQIRFEGLPYYEAHREENGHYLPVKEIHREFPPEIKFIGI